MEELHLRNRELRLYEDDLSHAKHDESLYNSTLDRFYMFLEEANNEDEFQPGNYRPK